MNSLPNFTQIFDEFKKISDKEKGKPIVVSILGQTGTGKSSLVNALFGTHFETNDVHPCTAKLQSHKEFTKSGQEIIFNDLPGIGESSDADFQYLQEYCRVIRESNVVLWAIHSDSRSTSFDKSSIKKIITLLGIPYDHEFLNKLVFVLTKSDLIFPDPWIFAHTEREFKIFPQQKTLELLRKKSQFVFEQLLSDYSYEITSEVVNDCKFNSQIDGFHILDEMIQFKGVLTAEKLAILVQQYPKYESVFERFHNIYMPVACSSYFRFNLDYLLYVIVHRLDFSGLMRFRSFIDEYNVREIETNRISQLSNLITLNKSKGEVIFSLGDYVKKKGLI